MREKDGYRDAIALIGMMFPDKKMLTVEETASALCCGRRTVTSLIEKGKLPAVDVGLGKYRIYRVSVKDLAKFITRR